ncbi:GNAT family N-acetyltransferase [soil metagenome]
MGLQGQSSSHLRLATPADIPALDRLIPASIRVLGAGFYTERQIEAAVMHVFGVDTQLIEDGTYYVAEADGEIVGCGGWSRRATLYGSDRAKGGSPDPLLDPGRDAARIRAFFVAPAWARRGIGSAIIRRCEAEAAAAGFRALELVATLPGERLYARHGYAAEERLEVEVPGVEPLPGVRMSKRVAGGAQ